MDISILDERLKDDLYTAIDGSKSILYRSEFVFLKPDADIELPALVESLIITQDFIGTYQDTIQITLRLPVAEYRKILENLQDMECTLTLYPVETEQLTDDLDKDPLILEYAVFLEGQVDLDKQVQSNIAGDNKEDGGTPMSSEQANPTVHPTFHLLSKKMRDIRKVQLNMVSREVDIETVIHWACQNFGMDQVVVIPPDNKAPISNFVIPPMKNLSNLFPYLQQRYGIYSKGLGYYYTNETLYMYPCFDTAEDTCPYKDAVVYLINGVGTMFRMSNVTSNWVENDLYIALTQTVKVSPVNTASSENKGDNLITVNADNTLDRLAPVGGDGKVIVNPNQTVIKRQNTATNMSSASQSVNYKDITSNIYQSTSELAADDGSILSTVWTGAQPFVLYPGQQVVYNYSSNDGDYKSTTGRLLAVRYVSATVGNDPRTPLLGFAAAISVFLEAEKKSDESFQYK